MTLLKRLLREPLVHFLLLGGLLFLYFEWRGSSGLTSSRIVITPGLVEHLASGFGRTWQRPPTDAELKGLTDDYVKEEIATREAVGMGLDRDDTIIRRRLRQKLEFLVEDAASSAPPTDAQLDAWLQKHPQSFPAEPRLAFRQVYVSPERRGASAGKDAEKLLARLRAKGKDATTDGLGDASMLPSEQPLAPLREVERSFGHDFARDLMKIEPGLAFAFGLLHGFGFARGLTAMGLPKAEIPLALLLFNVGVEIAQIALVVLILLLVLAFRKLEIRWPAWVRALPGYAVGSLGAYWTIQRMVLLFGGAR